MSRYIDADALRDKLYEADAVTMRGVAIINNEPTVDAVPVVRCKDCVYYSDEYGSCGRTDIIRSDMRIIMPNWFCADGERRTDETEGS